MPVTITKVLPVDPAPYNPDDPNPPPPPPPDTSFRFGSSKTGNSVTSFQAENDLIKKTSAETGKAGSVNNGLYGRRSYEDPGLVPTGWSGCKAVADTATLGLKSSCWSHKMSPADINSGNYDNRITGFYNSIPSGHFVDYCYWHECDVSFRSGKTATDYANFRRAAERLFDLLVASNADRKLVRFGILLTATGYKQGEHLDYFPGDGTLAGVKKNKFDLVMVDGYPFWRPDWAPKEPKTNSWPPWRDPTWIYSAAVDFAKTTGKDLIVGEWGAHPDEGRTQLYQWERDLGCGTKTGFTLPYAGNTLWKPGKLAEFVNWCVNDAGGAGVKVPAGYYFNSQFGQSGPWHMTSFHRGYNTVDEKDPKRNEDATGTTRDAESLKKIRDICALHGKR